MVTAYTVRRRFEKFNRLYWDSRLVLPRIVIIPAGQRGEILNGCDWGGVRTGEGKPTLMEIRAIAWEVDHRMLDSTLLHEMIHLEIGTDKAHGSREWNAAVRRLSAKGALKEVL